MSCVRLLTAAGANTRLVASAISRSERLLFELLSASLFWPLRSKVAEQFFHLTGLTPISFAERPDQSGRYLRAAPSGIAETETASAPAPSPQ